MTSLSDFQTQARRLLTSSSDPYEIIELESAHKYYSENISSHAISLELAKCLLLLCHYAKPRSILDLGSGFSSFVFRQYKEADVVSVDNNTNWIDITREYLTSQGLEDSNLVLWDHLDRSMKFDLVSYDLGRMPVRQKELAQAFHFAKPETGIIVLDDVHKSGYRQHVKNLIDERGYEFVDLKEVTLDQYGRHAWLVRRTKMRPLSTIYKPGYFARRSSLNWRAPIVCGAINDIVKPKRVVDVGCATGDLINGWIDLKVDAYGVEGSPGAREFLECPGERVLFHDLRIPLNNDRHMFIGDHNPVDLVTCFEVAEHIEEEYADQFVDNLISLGAPEILISAAPPGQGGHYHVNCQPYEYWEEKFKDRGYERVPLVEHKLKKALAPWRHKAGIKAYYNNVLHFWNGKMKRLVIGLGSGRTGSMSLARLLDAQPYCIGTHESFHMPWDVDLDQLDEAMKDLLSREAPLIFDIGPYWLNYVPLIKRRYEAKFICMYRDKEEIVASFLRKTWGYNSWTRQGSPHVAREHERYNKKIYIWFPHYDAPKGEAVRKYVDTYYALVDTMVDDSFRVFHVDNLNTADGIKSILDFAGIPEEQQVIKVFHENKNRLPGGGT